MAVHRLVECSFLIPVSRDSGLSDGKPHDADAWEWLMGEFWELFETPGTRAPGLYHGGYKDPDTGERVMDESRKYILAVGRRELRKLRNVLRQACIVFAQKCIYLSVAGKVEFVRHPLL